MARNSIKVILDEETIASVAEVAAVMGSGFDAALEFLVKSALSAATQQVPISPAKKSATKSRK